MLSRWRLFGDTLSADFFQAVKGALNPSSINELRDPLGVVQQGREALEDICGNFYSKLYAEANPSPEADSAREAILSCVRSKFTPEMISQLDLPFHHHVLHQMATSRSPGPDGITTEFFCKFWDLIGVEFSYMIQHSITEGRFPLGMTSGTIALIFKTRDRADLSNWRPITLLNVSYKILAKAMQIHLQPLLKDVISPEQSAFLPFHHILGNILLQYETVEWAKNSNQDLIFLKLDFTKAYDVVSWDFLLGVMKKLGIPDSFSHIVMMLLQDASASVLINGQPTPPFLIRRGVRQGCPLAPYLFLFVGETLHMAAS